MSMTKKILKRLASEGLNTKGPYMDTASTMKKLDEADKKADLSKKKSKTY